MVHNTAKNSDVPLLLVSFSIALLPIQIPISIFQLTFVVSVGDLLVASAVPFLGIALIRNSKFHRVWIIVFFFLTTAILSIVLAQIRGEAYFSFFISLSGLVKLVASVSWGIAVYVVLRENTRERFHYIALLSVVVALLSSLVGLYEVFVLGHPRSNGMTQGHRIGVNSFSNYLLMNIAFAFSLKEFFKSVFGTYLHVIPTVSILVVGVLTTGSRSALVGLIILIGLIFIYNGVFKGGKEMRRVFVVASAIPVVYIVINPLIIRRFELAVEALLKISKLLQDPKYTAAFGNRLIWWSDAIETFKELPVFGVGFNQFTTYNASKGTPHNIYLKFLSEMGMVGVLVYMSLLAWLVKLGISARKVMYGTSMYILFYLAATAVMGMFLDTENFRQMWLAIGVLVATHEGSAEII